MINQVVTDHCISFLNEMLKADRTFVSEMMEKMTPCNEAILEHPTIQVRTQEDGFDVPCVTMLGVLNGLCGVFDDGKRKSWGPITAVFDGDTSETIERFEMTKNE